MSDLCVCMRDVISEFNSEIEGSLAFCALMLFLCSILCLMCCVLGVVWLVRVLSSKEYVCCVCDPSVCLGVHSICQICVFV